MGRGVAWLDAGTHESLLQAANFVPGSRGSAGHDDLLPGGDRLSDGYVGRDELRGLGEAMKSNEYGRYLLRLVSDEALPR